MQEAPIGNIPEWIELKIIHMLDFKTLLNARATCQRWNDMILPYLAQNSILNIRMEGSIASKRFRRGKWNERLIAPYEEIRIIPKLLNAFFYGKAKSRTPSSLKHFTHVKKFTLFENGSFLHFIHRYMRLLPNVKYVQIRELPYNEKTPKYSKYPAVGSAFPRALGHFNSWSLAMDNLSKVETLRIRLFDRVGQLLYMNLFAFRMTTLANLELDFTKFFDIPLSRAHINQLNVALCEILEHCYISLKQLRLKWAIRVDTDLDYFRSEEDIEPFFEFLLSLRNPIWMKLRLQQLSLNFPTVNFGLILCDSTLFPFLLEQIGTLKRASFSRVLPNAGMDVFAARFPPPMIQKFEFVFYFNDAEMAHQPVTCIRGMEILLSQNPSVDISRLLRLSRGRREMGFKSLTHFKVISGHGNLALVKPDLARITETFQNIRVLELLDTSVHGKMYASLTSADFNIIVKRLRRLVSLKLSNASSLSDFGLTKIPKAKINYMKRIGVYHFPNPIEAPVAQAKELRFLDLRDLTTHVSDVSVYFAFQYIRKLEKISFHGCHSITSWGKELLKQKYRKNPYFDAIFKSYNDDRVTFGNYILPSADFP